MMPSVKRAGQYAGDSFGLGGRPGDVIEVWTCGYVAADVDPSMHPRAPGAAKPPVHRTKRAAERCNSAVTRRMLDDERRYGGY